MSFAQVGSQVGSGRVARGFNPYHFAYTGQTDEGEIEDTEEGGSFNLSDEIAVRIDLEYVLNSFADGYNIEDDDNIGVRVGYGNPDTIIPWRLKRTKNREVYDTKNDRLTMCRNMKCKRPFYRERTRDIVGNRRRLVQYCSVKCRKEVRAIYALKYYHNKPKILLTCAYCKEGFYAHKTNKYCSPKCVRDSEMVKLCSIDNLNKCAYHKCNRLFKKHKTITGSDGLIYCSPACCRHW